MTLVGPLCRIICLHKDASGGDADFSSRWHAIKAGFAGAIEPGERLSGRRLKKGERGIWQRRFWEHALRDEKDLERHVDYIHFNPVKHGHVGRAADWSYSSFHRFAARGVYARDWGASAGVGCAQRTRHASIRMYIRVRGVHPTPAANHQW